MIFPNFLKPYFIKKEQLVRLGSIDDGGYVLPINDVKSSDVLISFSISDNWDFEKDFCKISKAKIIAYDYSIDSDFWILRFKKDLKKFIQLKIFKLKKVYKMFKYIDFIFFFKKHKKNLFFLKRIGNSENCQSVHEIIYKHTKKNDKIFFKIDIEGSEYEILDQIIFFKDKIQGIVIEFHDVVKKLDIIKNFLSRINPNLNLVHIHANNYSVKDEKQFPEAIELTISSTDLQNQVFDKQRDYPIKNLDFPNSKRSPDIKINFEIK